MPNFLRTTTLISPPLLPPVKLFHPLALTSSKVISLSDDFKSDIVKILNLYREKYIIVQTNYSCLDSDNSLYYNASTSTIPYSQGTRWTQKKETSYGTNNQVPNVQERELVPSDGEYIFASADDRILVSDLNGEVVVNVTIPSPNITSMNYSSYVLLETIFLNNNILTALGSMGVCYDDYNCNSTYSAFYFNFNGKAKTMTLVKQYDITSFFSYKQFQRHHIGDFTYVLASESFGEQDYFFDLQQQLNRCNENYKGLSADEYEAVALEYLNTVFHHYASEIVAKLSKEGATSVCDNIIKMFNETFLQLHDVSFTITKVISIGLNGTSKQPYFFPFSHSHSHISKNSMLVTVEGTTPGNGFLIKFSMNDLVTTPSSVGTLDGSIFDIDLYNGYYRISSNSYPVEEVQVAVLEEQNSHLAVVGHAKVGAGTVHSSHFFNEKGFLVTIDWNGINDKGIRTTMNLLNLTSPTNPSISATEILNSSLHNVHPIGDGNYIISIIDNIISNSIASGVTVYLFQANSKSFKLVGEPSEVIITEHVSWGYPMVSSYLWRYHSQSHKLIFPVTSRYFDNIVRENDDGYFNGFIVFNVDLDNGVKYLGNVTHDSVHSCNTFSTESMVFNGDLITVMGNTIKRTSNLTTLSSLKWELEDYCGYYNSLYY